MTDSSNTDPELIDVLDPEVEQTPEEVEKEDDAAPIREIRVMHRDWKRRGRKGGYYYRETADDDTIDLTREELDQIQKRGGFASNEALPSRKIRSMYGAEGRYRLPYYARNQLARGFKTHLGTDDYGDTVEQHARLGLVSNRSAHDYWPTFVRDVFASMYGMAKSEVGQNEPAWAREMLDTIESDENIKTIRRGARLDPEVALEATKKILGSITVPSPETDAQRQKREDGAEQPSEDPSKLSARQKRQKQQEAERLQAAMKDAAEKSQKAQDKHHREEQAGDMGEGGQGYGPGQGFQTFEGYARMTDRFNHVAAPQLADIAEIAGRAMSTAYNSRAKNAAAPGGITDVECGRDIQKWLPAELALLACPETEMLALSKFAESSALQFKTEGEDDMGRGPIVLFIDLSGSMHCPDITYRGKKMTRNVWAAGVALALWQVATWQGRECRLIGYTGNVCYDYVIESEEKAAEILSRCYHGGTSLGNAITYVKNKGYDKRADFVVVSDGEDYGWEGPAIEAKRNSDVRIHAVAIAGEWNCTDLLESYTHVNGDDLDLSDQYAAL